MTTLLIADDDRLFRTNVRKMTTQWGYETDEAEDGLEAWEKLTSLDAPDLAILDGMMPGLDGIEICRRMRLRRRTLQSTYLLLLSEGTNDRARIAGRRSGADDFLAKPVDPAELEARLMVGARSVALRSELDVARETLLREATHDVLTEILNRRGIIEALKREYARSARAGSPLSVALIDVDHFRKINDTWGNQAGDAVLTDLAGRFSSGVGRQGRVGRFGGEEFLLLLPGTAAAAATEAAERIRRVVRETPFGSGSGRLQVTVSAGVASMIRGKETPDDLLRRAGNALHRAKSSGRDRVVLDPSGVVEEVRPDLIPATR